MRKTLKDGAGVLIAFLVFWGTGVLSLALVVSFWPIKPDVDAFALKPQHFPSVALGFLFALYAFRRFTAEAQLSKG